MFMQCTQTLGVKTVEMADGLSASHRHGISQMRVPRRVSIAGNAHYMGLPADNKTAPASAAAEWY
jgi:hypothetical protein